MITPYEAVLAFVPNKEWTGEYNIGFGALLGLGSEESEEENGGGDQQQGGLGGRAGLKEKREWTKERAHREARKKPRCACGRDR